MDPATRSAENGVATSMHLPYPIAIDNGQFAASYGARSLPETIFIDRRRRARDRPRYDLASGLRPRSRIAARRDSDYKRFPSEVCTISTYILVHGAWHGGWCWDKVVPLLEARGHTVLAPDLASLGNDRTPLAEVSLAGWRDQIVDLISAQTEPVILVGHSRGGVVISEIAEKNPGPYQNARVFDRVFVPGRRVSVCDRANRRRCDTGPILRAERRRNVDVPSRRGYRAFVLR